MRGIPPIPPLLQSRFRSTTCGLEESGGMEQFPPNRPVRSPRAALRRCRALALGAETRALRAETRALGAGFLHSPRFLGRRLDELDIAIEDDADRLAPDGAPPASLAAAALGKGAAASAAGSASGGEESS